MPRPTSKHDLLEAALRERGKLDAVLETLTPEQMVEPGVVGEWSVKDVLAHLHEWERMALGWYRTGLRGEVPDVPAPGYAWRDTPQLNRAIFETYRDRPHAEVVATFRASRQDMLGAIESLSDEDLFTSGRFAWTRKNALGAYLVSATSSHDLWARTRIARWLRLGGVQDRIGKVDGRDPRPDRSAGLRRADLDEPRPAGGAVTGRARGATRVAPQLLDLNRATLARNLLLERERVPVVDAVRRLVALQAQEPASPYVALWNRVTDFDPAELDAAFRSFAVVKATLLRITLHAVAVDDHARFHEAMRPTLRAAGLHEERFRATGLTVADADALVPQVLDFAHRPRTRAAIEAMLADRLGAPPRPDLWRALRAIAPLVHAPTGAPWAFGRVASYVAAPDPAIAVDGAPRASVPREGGAAAVGGDAALRRLVLRYLAAFGPASRQDFAQFATLRQTEVRPAFEALADELVVRSGPDGSTLYDVAGAPLPDGDTPAPPRLLGMWDSVLLAYADRSRVIPPAYRADVIRRNGDVLPTVLVDGFVAGVWRPVHGGVEVTAFHELSVEAWDAIEQEARALRPLLVGREHALYARFGHWWSRLPAAAGGLRLVPPSSA